MIIRFPEFIERIQRRKHFRIETPYGSKLNFEVNSTRRELNLIDISLGGVFGVLARLKQEIQMKPILKIGGVLEHIEMIFPVKEGEQTVNIKKAAVVRFEEDPQTAKHRYAFQFKEIKRHDQRKLKELVYRFQREFLQKR